MLPPSLGDQAEDAAQAVPQHRDGERGPLRPVLRGRARQGGEDIQPLGAQVPQGQPQENRD